MRFRLGVVAFWICVLFSTICNAVSVSGIPSSAYIGDTIAFHAEEVVGGDLQTYSYCKFVYYPHADGVQYQPDVYGNQAQTSNNYENINKGQTIQFDGSFIVKEEMLEGKSEKAGEFTVHVWCFKDAVFSNTPTWASYPAKVTWTAKKQPVSSCSSSANNISLNYLKISADKLKFDIKFTNGQCEDIKPHYYVYLDGKQEMDEYGQTTSPKTSSTLTYTINKLITPGDHVVKVCLVSSQGGDCNTDPFTWAPTVGCQCAADEECTPNGCVKKTGCPPCPSGKTCNNGQCTPIKTCTPGEKICTNDDKYEVLDANCNPITSVQCKTNEYCTAYGCLLKQGCNPPCNSGESCINNACQKCPANLGCTQDKKGYHYTDASCYVLYKECNSGESCANNTCVANGQTCTQGNYCKDASTVAWKNSDCQWSTYWPEIPCAQNQTCLNGACVAKSGCNPPCNSDASCINNTCQASAPSCKEINKYCDGDTLVTVYSNNCPIKSFDCSQLNLSCTNGSCEKKKCTSGWKCTSQSSYVYTDEYCSPSKEESCPKDAICTPSVDCMFYKYKCCVKKQGCQYENPPCDSGKTCKDNACVKACMPGLKCLSKTTYTNVYDNCSDNGTHECASGEVCSDVPGENICIKSQCTSGDCCDKDKQKYLPYGTVCKAQAEKKYECPQGDGAVYVKYQDKVCSGQYHECYQLSQNWSELAKVEDCDSYSKCVAGQSKCQGACVDAWECVENNTAKAHHLSNCKWEDTTYCGKGETCIKGACVTAGGAGGSGGVCEIVLARWNKTQVTSGEQVPMDVLTTPGCNGKNVEFKVHKTGKTASWWNIFGILTKFKRTKVVDGVASIDWKAQYVADWQSPPEFSFIATVDGKSKFSENIVKVTAFQTVDWVTLKSNFANKPVIIFKPTAPSAALDQQITLLKSALEKVTKSVEIKLPDLKGNCFLTSAASSSIVVIGTATTNPLYACAPKDADPDSGVYATANPWSESDEFGAVWIRSEVGDNSFFNIYTFRDAMLDQAFITDVETKAWDYSTACFYEGDFSKVYYPKFGALICYAIPASQLVPDVRAIWKNCSLFSALLVANPMGDPMVISIDNWMPGTLTNYMMCKMVIGMFALDVMGAAGTIKTVTGLAKATGTGPLGKFALQLKGLLDAAENGNKELTDLVLKVLPFKWSSSLKSAQKAVIENAADDGGDLAMAVLKDQALGPDVAEKAFGYMSKLAKPSGGWTPEAIEGIGRIFKFRTEKKMQVTLFDSVFTESQGLKGNIGFYEKLIKPLNPDDLKIVTKIFGDDNVADEVNVFRESLGKFLDKDNGLAKNNHYEIIFGSDSNYTEFFHGLTTPNLGSGSGHAIFIRAKKILSYDEAQTADILRYHTIPHELAEEQLLLQFGPKKYGDFEGFIKSTGVNEHFVESLLVIRGKAKLFSDIADTKVLKFTASAHNAYTDADTIVNAAFKYKGDIFIANVAQEWATAMKYGNNDLAENIEKKLSNKLMSDDMKNTYFASGVSKEKADAIVIKMKEVGNKISETGNLIALDPLMKSDSDVYKNKLAELVSVLKSLDIYKLLQQ